VTCAMASVKGKEIEFCDMDRFPLSGARINGNPRGDGMAE